ncbi:MAG: ABC transporter permease [Firmicutes bacterium]|nr:ABC transporter permease [Bacillota bacterium]
MKKRIGHYLIILVIVIVANFFIPRLLPGSPIKTLIGEDTGQMTAEEKMGILDSYHLNDPITVQFGYYIKDLFSDDWGLSFSKRQPIKDLLKSAAGWTLLLSSVSMFFSIVIGCCLGAHSARKRKTKSDLNLILGTTFLSSIPPFWVAILLLAVFGAQLRWFPTYGAYSMWSDKQGLAYVLDVSYHLVLPVLALVLTSLLPYFTTTRYSVLKIINEDYIKMAKIRGVPDHTINVRYVMHNAIIPVFTMVMLDVGYLLSGSILIETVFSYPGLGVLMRDAVTARDYPLIQYTFLISSVLTIIALFLADLCYRKLDPSLEGADEK